jgi:hypothetical protein
VGTYDTRGGSPRHDPAADNEAAIGPLEEEVLGVLEEMDRAYASWAASREELKRLLERVLLAWIRPGEVLDARARGPRPACLRGFNVASGAARGATTFRVAGAPRVNVAADGDPSLSYWICDAVPISPTTGKDMSGRPSGAVRNDATVTLRGQVLIPIPLEITGPALVQAERDEFIRMVAEAERVLAGEQVQEQNHAQQGTDLRPRPD